MKRPLAVIGFSMLTTFAVISKLTFTETVAITIMATVLFLLFLAFKKIRKNIFFMTILASAIAFSTCFLFAQNHYMGILEKGLKQEICGTVSEARQSSENAYTYVIKIKGEGYKIRYISKENRDFDCGDEVSGTVILNVNDTDRDYFESSLASKVYFTCFEEDENMLAVTGRQNKLYSAITIVKEWFVNTISLYLPGDNGAIAKAMSIGDRSGLTEDIMQAFNYSGISHLLVVSGLHLSLWALGIISFLQKIEKLRRFTPVIGLFSLLGYSLLAGFGVSVIRAGIMVGISLLGRLLKRDWDSINSVGFSLVIILLVNPFAPHSASLWFTVMSTIGILVCADPLSYKILQFKILRLFKENSIFNFLISSVVISISTSVFTALVFITQFNLMPIASIFSNLLSVTPAMVLMLSTVAGVFCHLLGATSLAQGLFSLAGGIGEFLQKVAETVGKSEYSTISVASPIYKYFLVFALICIVIALAFKNRRQLAIKSVSVVLSITFILLTLFVMSNDYTTLTIHISNEKGIPLTILNYGDDVTMVGDFSATQSQSVTDIITTHNKKNVDNIFVTQDDGRLASKLSLMNKLNFAQNAEINSQNDNCQVYEKENSILVIYKNVKILLINDKPYENCFENADKYDIIITNMQDESENAHLLAFLENENSLLINLSKGEKVTITCKQESFYATYN